jgi:hypothetical protein
VPRAAAVVLLALIASGCAGVADDRIRPGATIDGLILGQAISCDNCAAIDAAASQRLESRHANDAAVVDTRYFADPLPSGAARSGTSTVVVFSLSDGSRAAYLVYCGVGGCSAG